MKPMGMFVLKLLATAGLISIFSGLAVVRFKEIDISWMRDARQRQQKMAEYMSSPTAWKLPALLMGAGAVVLVGSLALLAHFSP